MLVLSRQIDQTIIIGDDVEVTIVDIRGDKVRLGINAPRSVSVHRKEIYLAVQRENRARAQALDVATNSSVHVGNGSDPFIAAAIDEARCGLEEGGLPIGSVLVRDGKIIGRGHNRRVQKGDPMAHAEIDCLSRARRQKTYSDTVLYSTLMPCHLCSGAVVQFGIPRVVVGESINFGGAPDFLRQHGVEVVDLKDPQCIHMMADFIKAHPDLWHEDIGR
jgi:cytosine/creatinine deaminase